MKTCILFLTFIFAINLNGQSEHTGTLEVFVHDHYTFKPLEYALIALLQDGVVVDSALTNMHGIANIRIPATSVREPDGLPTSISLSHNYPNPFKEITTVDISAPEAQTLNATIYNVLGQRVASEQIPVSAGYYTLSLSLRHLPAGVYFLWVEGRESHAIKLLKMGRAVHQAGPIFSISTSSFPEHVSIEKTKVDGFTLKVTRERYEIYESSITIYDDSEIRIPLERLNEVVFQVDYNNNLQFKMELAISGLTIDDFRTSTFTPGSLILKSGVYYIDGETDSTLVSKVVEISSNDTIFVFDSFPETTQSLKPGGIIRGVDRVAVGAPEGAIQQEIEVRIEKVEDPTVDIPLPEYINREDLVGNFYEFTASDEVIIDDHNYLIIGLPVPEGIPTDNLSIAILMSPEMINIYGEFEPSMLWTTERGYYEEESGLFGAIVPYVGTIPYTAVLVKGVSYIEIDDVDNSSELGKLGTDHEPFGFHVKCIGFSPGECTENHIMQTKNALDEAYESLVVQLGYQKPRLRTKVVEIKFSIIPPRIVREKRYRYRLEKKDSHNGYYSAYFRRAATQFPSGDSPNDLITRHEFFHSLQYGFRKFHSNISKCVFGVVEGTAAASEMSIGGLRRSNIVSFGRFPMEVDVSMLLNTRDFSNCVNQSKIFSPCGSDYRTQDFWIYVGKVINPSNPQIDFLIPLFQKGGLRQHIDEMLQEDGTFTSLSDAYWHWAKNQSFEKSVILGHDHNDNPVPGGDPCTLYGRAANPKAINYFIEYWEDYSEDFKLDPLTSKVLQFNFQPDEQAYETKTSIISESDNLRVKFYIDYEIGTNGCKNREDKNSHNFTVDGMVTAYALVSNVHPEKPLNARLEFSEPTTTAGTVTDIDGNKYQTVKIGDQWWMSENLKVSKYQNGDIIPNITASVDWNNLTAGAWANYNNDQLNKELYGKLYNWYAVRDTRGICPPGWHVPEYEEWSKLFDYLGGLDLAGGKMKSVNTEPAQHPRWDAPNTGATNESGYSALPGGLRSYLGDFSHRGAFTGFWSSTFDDSGYATGVSLGFNSSEVGIGAGNIRDGFSIRCVRN